MLKLLALAASFLPVCFHMPYLFRAWNSSRLDQWDWIFFVLALPAALWAVRTEKTGKCDPRALLLLLPMLFLTATGPFHHINALCVASAAGTLFAAVWLLYSWNFAFRVLPAAIMLLLGTPSSSYQLSLLLMCPVTAAWAIKFLAGAGCFIWIYCAGHFNWQVKPGALFFSAAALCSCVLFAHTREIYFEGKSFIPQFKSRIGHFFGRTMVPDENTRRFFATGTAVQYRYTGNNTDISVLEVKCGRNIHEIHPASHCLRTGMWTVNSEKTLYLQPNFAVTEIDASKGQNRILVWVWYSSEEFSTPGFLGFRRHVRAGKGNYYTYQISTAIYGSAESGRNILHEFIKLLKKAETR